MACPAGCVTSVSQRCLAGAGGAAAAPLAQGAKPGAGLWIAGDGDEVRFSHCLCVRGESRLQDTLLLTQDIM